MLMVPRLLFRSPPARFFLPLILFSRGDLTVPPIPVRLTRFHALRPVGSVLTRSTFAFPQFLRISARFLIPFFLPAPTSSLFSFVPLVSGIDYSSLTCRSSTFMSFFATAFTLTGSARRPSPLWLISAPTACFGSFLVSTGHAPLAPAALRTLSRPLLIEDLAYSSTPSAMDCPVPSRITLWP